MTRAGRLLLGQGVSAAAIRPTESPCGISSHVVACNQFRGPGLRTPTVWLGLGLRSTQGLGVRMKHLKDYPHVDTPIAGTRKHDRVVPNMLNPRRSDN